MKLANLKDAQAYVLAAGNFQAIVQLLRRCVNCIKRFVLSSQLSSLPVFLNLSVYLKVAPTPLTHPHPSKATVCAYCKSHVLAQALCSFPLARFFFPASTTMLEAPASDSDGSVQLLNEQVCLFGFL